MELVKVSYMYLHPGSFDKHRTTSGRGGKDQLRMDLFTTSWFECQFIHVPTRTANYHRTQLAFISYYNIISKATTEVKIS